MPSSARARRVFGPWRVALLLYVIALEIGTHWPRLELGSDSVPISDKLIHAAAFGAGAALLWLSGVLRRPRHVLLAGIAWAALDEITQAAPGLGRTSSWSDLCAGAIGVAVVALMLWAFAPLGRPDGAARRSQRRATWALEEALGSWRALFLIAAGALLLAPVGAAIGRLIFSLPRIERPALGLLEGGLLGAAAGAQMTMEFLRRRFLAAAPRRCFECDAGVPAFGPDGSASCPGCGADVRVTQWDEPPQPRRSLVGLIGALVLGAALLVVATFALELGLGVLRLRTNWELPARIGRWYGDLGYDLRLLVELFWVALLAALVIRALRSRRARQLDRQHERCVGCGFDLRGTRDEGGRGTCPECGGSFAGGA